MRTPEEIIKEGNEGSDIRTIIDNLSVKEIIELIKEAQIEAYNQAIEDAAEDCESYQLTDVYGVGIGEFVYLTDSESILKLKKSVVGGG